MKVALTGASGQIGRHLSRGLRARGHQVIALSRPEFDLDAAPPPLAGIDWLIHAAFAHIPGKYRGGEGDDPAGFTRRNLGGSIALFDRAAADGVGHITFLSSRAVYDGTPDGARLTEDMVEHPTSLYGQVKFAAEQHLATLPLPSTALRATGVYTPGPGHKWTDLFAQYRAGAPIAPRAGTELHVDDLTQAALLSHGLPGARVLNLSDLLLDRRDLLTEVARLSDCPHLPPARATQIPNQMDCARLRALGWAPGGMALLRASLPSMLG